MSYTTFAHFGGKVQTRASTKKLHAELAANTAANALGRLKPLREHYKGLLLLVYAALENEGQPCTIVETRAEIIDIREGRFITLDERRLCLCATEEEAMRDARAIADHLLERYGPPKGFESAYAPAAPTLDSYDVPVRVTVRVEKSTCDRAEDNPLPFTLAEAERIATARVAEALEDWVNSPGTQDARYTGPAGTTPFVAVCVVPDPAQAPLPYRGG